MLRDVHEGRIQAVLVYKIDRLTRSTKDFHTLMEVLEAHGVNFIATSQSLDLGTPTGRLMRNILLDFAQFEREMTADRTRDKMQQRAEKGLWNGGIPPYGYKNSNKQLVLHPEEAPRVRFIFEHFSRDRSIGRVRQELNRRGWLTRAGNPWSKMGLINILKNPTYTGKKQHRGKLFDGLHEAIIDEALFRRVQRTTPDRSHTARKSKRVFLLKGLVRCNECGSVMTPHYTQKRRKDGSVNRIGYYRCTKTIHLSNKACPIRHVNADQLEDAVVENLHELSQNESYVKETVATLNADLSTKTSHLETDISRIRKRLGAIDREIDRYVQALGKGRLSVERLEAEIAHRQDDKIALEAELEELQRKINENAVRDFDAELVSRNLRDFRKAFKGLEAREQAEALQCLLKSVLVQPERLTLEICELPGFTGSSQNHKDWLPRQIGVRTGERSSQWVSPGVQVDRGANQREEFVLRCASSTGGSTFEPGGGPRLSMVGQIKTLPLAGRGDFDTGVFHASASFSAARSESKSS
jgi:hypothetical protein